MRSNLWSSLAQASAMAVVAQHANTPWDLGKVSSWYNRWWLVVNANLESSGAPVNELDRPLGLDCCDGCIDVLGDDVAPVEHAAGHVLAMPRVALHHLVGRLKAGIGDLSNRQLLVVGLLGGDHRGVDGQGEMDPRVGHQVRLELSEVDVKGAVEPQRGCDGGDDLSNQSVEVGVGWSLDVEVASADVVDGLVVHHEGAVRVLEGGMRRQDGVVRFNHGSRNLRGGIDGEFQLGLLAVVHGESLHQEGGEAGASSASKGVEDEETLEAGAHVR